MYQTLQQYEAMMGRPADAAELVEKLIELGMPVEEAVAYGNVDAAEARRAVLAQERWLGDTAEGK